MNCVRARTHSMSAAPPAAAVRHLHECSGCREWQREHRRLLALLDLDHPGAEPAAAESGFLPRLHQRIAAAEAAGGAGWRGRWQRWQDARRSGAAPWLPAPAASLAAAAMLLLSAGVFLHFGGASAGAPQRAQAPASAAVRDLQVMNQYGALLDNIDFLSVPDTAEADPSGPHSQ